MNADPSPPLEYPRERGSPAWELPLASEGPADFFPPVCLKSHWDPTRILARTLPDQRVAQPLDPRPWTRICMEYTTAGGQEPAPAVAASTVLPSGGQFYPPTRYQAAVDAESQLRRLDRPLGIPEKDQWEPTLGSDMYDPKKLVPREQNWRTATRVQELAYPRALLRSGPYDCREQEDMKAIRLTSGYLFNNATKQDRYKTTGKDAKPAAPAYPLEAVTKALRPDLDFSAVQPEWQRQTAPGAEPSRSYEAAAAEQRRILATEATTPEQQRTASEAGTRRILATGGAERGTVREEATTPSGPVRAPVTTSAYPSFAFPS